jgi:serine/threonine protein kinase
MPASSSGSRSGLVLELAEEFLDRYRVGERPALKEYIDRHPELAAEIREVFPAMAMMEHIALADETIDADQNGISTMPHLEQLGDYRVLREVGRGGMGVVYEAEQVSLGRHVALKVLPPQSLKDVKQRRRFEREAKAAAKLHHTNIVPVFGVGEEHETPYYVMQFIQGQGLDAVLDELKRLRANPSTGSQAGVGTDADGTAAYQPMRRDVSAAEVAHSLLTGRFEPADDRTTSPDETPSVSTPTEAASDTLSSSSLSLPGVPPRGKSKRQSYWQGVARIGHQVADALAYAHGQGVVHRDIKPSNLLLDTKGTVWVADFGLAKATDQQDLTHTGDLLGTLRYMPPEAFGGKADSRGDIYSLGLTLYEILAFRPAFDERDRGQLVKQVTTDEPPRLKKLNPEVPRDLETIVQKAIERDPAHRYASASELADDLRRFVDDEPIQARRATVAERLARWGRRNPAVAGLTAVIATLLVAGTIVASASAYRFNRMAERENSARSLADSRADAEAKARLEAAAVNKALLSSQDSLRSTLYAARMNLTKAAWESVNPARALDLLAASIPKPGEPDPRGFEWHYWRRMAHGESTVRKLPGLGQPGFRSRAFSPDGSLAAAVEASSDQNRARRLLVYETATGRLFRKLQFEVPGTNENLPLPK